MPTKCAACWAAIATWIAWGSASPTSSEASMTSRRAANSGAPPPRQRLQGVDAGAREQGGDHLERRVLGGGADQGDRPVLDIRQDGVLLGLVEAMDLVDEQERAPRRARPGAAVHPQSVAGLGDDAAGGGDAGGGGGG